MSIVHKVTQTWISGNNTLAVQATNTSNAEINISDTVAASGTHVEYTVAFTITNLECIYISSTTDMTLKTNETGSPDDTILLKANRPFVWMKNSGITVPFVGDSGAITKFYFTNGLVESTLEIRILKDTTP